MSGKKIIIGTRSSELALVQAGLVKAGLEQAGTVAEIQVISTSGDKIQDRPLYDIGGKGLFVKELDEQLLMGRIDLAVHSLKDIPGVLESGVEIAAVLPREDVRDCFLSAKYASLTDLPDNAVIGTSSVRRTAQLLAKNPARKISAMRGNVPTRIQKLQNGEVDAIILAYAGLKRLGLDSHIRQILSLDEMLPAIGQGAIAVTIRQNDSEMKTLLAPLNSEYDFIAITAERAIMGPIGASCTTPVAAHAIVNGGNIHLRALLAARDGSHVIHEERFGFTDEAEELGIEIGEEFTANGGNILEQ